MSHEVLIVDDEPTFLEEFARAYKGLLKQEGLKIQTKTSTAEAKRYLKQHGKDIMLMIADIRLPLTRDGKGLLAYVRKEFPGIRTIAMTGEARRREVGKMGAAGLFDGYFEKDASEKTTRAELLRVLSKRPQIPPEDTIANALNTWVERHPELAKRKLRSLANGNALTVPQVAREIKNRTPRGKRYASVLLEMACDVWRSDGD